LLKTASDGMHARCVVKSSGAQDSIRTYRCNPTRSKSFQCNQSVSFTYVYPRPPTSTGGWCGSVADGVGRCGPVQTGATNCYSVHGVACGFAHCGAA
jgi:hypothetical protein